MIKDGNGQKTFIIIITQIWNLMTHCPYSVVLLWSLDNFLLHLDH